MGHRHALGANVIFAGRGSKQVLMAAIGALALAGGLAAGLAGPARAASPAAMHGASSVAVYDCANKPEVRPGSFELACDGSDEFGKLSWTTWSAAMATATGVQYVDGCDPNCAQGKWTHQNVIVILWKAVNVPGHAGRLAYTKITVLYPDAKGTQSSSWTGTPPGAF